MLAFVLIHDKEPSDSGSDVGRGSMLPENFDLHVNIKGVFSSLERRKLPRKSIVVQFLMLQTKQNSKALIGLGVVGSRQVLTKEKEVSYT